MNKLNLRNWKDNKRRQSSLIVFVMLLAWLSLLWAIVGIIFEIRGYFEYTAVGLVLFVSLVLVIESRKNELLLILSLFIGYANYSAMAANYFVFYDAWYQFYAGSLASCTMTYILLAFMSILLLLFPKNLSPFSGSDLFNRCLKVKNAPLISLLVVAILLIIAFTQSSGFSDTGGRAQSNQLYEYSYILFIIGFYFSGGSRFCRYSLTIVAIVFLAQAILGGNRASVLAIALILYVVYIAGNWKLSKQVPMILLAFLFFQIAGELRQDIDTATISDWALSVEALYERAFIWDTAAAAYHQGIVFIQWLTILSPNDTFYYACQWAMSIILGGSLVPDSVISLVSQNIFGVGALGGMGGGFLPAYAYFYFGFIGVCVFAAAVAIIFYLVRYLSPNSGDVVCMVTIALFSTIPRWWLYTPSPITRGLLLVLLCAGLAYLLKKTICRLENRKNHTKAHTETNYSG